VPRILASRGRGCSFGDLRGDGFRRRSVARVGSAFAVAALLLAGCGSEAPRAPNVLLVTIDTLRADRLSSYGYARQTSPFLDELAAAGIRFDRAYATASWTAPSVASLMTSLEPSVHGIEHGFIDDDVIVKQEVIPESVALWPELLREAGYRTYGVTANTHLYGHFGFAQGFDRYECVGFLDATKVIAVVDKWRGEIVGGDDPWFLWVHLLDPHGRYRPRKPWIQEYFPHFRPLWMPIRNVFVPENYKQFGVTRGTRVFDLVNALYDSEIAYTDRAIRSIAEKVGLAANDLVVVTSDHGEEFLDHGGFGHGITLYEEVIRVPLILRMPGAAHAGRVVSAPVSLIDVLPTVLDIVGAEAPAELQGTSLLPIVEGDEADERVVVASLARFVPLGTDSITRGRWKYIQHRVEKDRRMLFDVAADPAETRNLLESDPERAQALADALAAHLEANRARRIDPDTIDLSADEFEQLKALGYVPR